MCEDGFKDAEVVRVDMQGRIVIKEAIDELDVNALRDELDTENCGAIVSFLGITRGMEKGDEVLRLNSMHGKKN